MDLEARLHALQTELDSAPASMRQKNLDPSTLDSEKSRSTQSLWSSDACNGLGIPSNIHSRSKLLRRLNNKGLGLGDGRIRADDQGTHKVCA